MASTQQPLIVIDGVIQMQNDPSMGARAVQGQAAQIDANGVASVEILQGAEAAARYGQRAANGVINVTTKAAAAKTGSQQASKASSAGTMQVQSVASAVAMLQRTQASTARSLTAHETVAFDESLRQARTVADLDRALASGNTKRVGDRMFALVDSTWIDMRHSDSLSVTKIKPYSEVYFELLKSVPSLNPVFALGDRVLVAGSRMSIFLDEKGVEKLTREQLDAIVKQW
jgi:TonB-dependent SusC/RagA subfamily outer membrane receptor